MSYGKLPRLVSVIDFPVEEYMYYQYLPIKLSGQTKLIIEPRIQKWFSGVIGNICCDFVANFGLDTFVDSNIYVCAKSMYQDTNNTYNRHGWHTDGFMTKDINYIWSNCNGTVFNNSSFELTKDDDLSMYEMQLQAKDQDNIVYTDNSVLQLDQYVVHKVNPLQLGQNRAFLKVSFSKDKYDLKGNSKNYSLNYDWMMRDRGFSRNTPQLLSKNTC